MKYIGFGKWLFHSVQCHRTHTNDTPVKGSENNDARGTKL